MFDRFSDGPNPKNLEKPLVFIVFPACWPLYLTFRFGPRFRPKLGPSWVPKLVRKLTGTPKNRFREATEFSSIFRYASRGVLNRKRRKIDRFLAPISVLKWIQNGDPVDFPSSLISSWPPGAFQGASKTDFTLFWMISTDFGMDFSIDF